MFLLIYQAIKVTFRILARMSERKTSKIEATATAAAERLQAAENAVNDAGNNVAKAVVAASPLPAAIAAAERLAARWEKSAAHSEKLKTTAANLSNWKGRTVPYVVGKLDSYLLVALVLWLPTVVDIAEIGRGLLALVQHSDTTVVNAE